MTDNTTKQPEPKTVLEDMESRSLFSTVEEAVAYLTKCAEDFSDWDSYPVVTVGFTEDGDFDPAVYNESMQVTVAKMTEKGSKEANRESRVLSIVIYPTPKLEALDSPEAQAWLASLVAKECNLIAMRPLRKSKDAADMVDAAQSMPTTVAEYITSQRETSSGILETFNTLWQLVKKALGERYKSFALANLSKKELRKAMESASYAATVYPHLETRQNKRGEQESFFVMAAQLGLALAKADGLDPAIFDRMLTTRDDKEIEAITDEDADDFDIEAMAAALAKKPEPTDSQTAEEAPAE